MCLSVQWKSYFFWGGVFISRFLFFVCFVFVFEYEFQIISCLDVSTIEEIKYFTNTIFKFVRFARHEICMTGINKMFKVRSSGGSHRVKMAMYTGV